MPEMPTRGGFEMLHLMNDLPMPEWRRKKLKDFSSLRERIWLINNWRRRQKIKILVNQTIGNTSSKTGKKEWDDALFLFWRGNSPAANYNLEDGIRGEGRHQSISRRTLCYIYKYIYKYSVSSLLRLDEFQSRFVFARFYFELRISNRLIVMRLEYGVSKIDRLFDRITAASSSRQVEKEKLDQENYMQARVLKTGMHL